MPEVLFARAEQEQTFLRMAVCGLVLGALLQARRGLAGWRPRLAWLGDLAAAGGLAACVFPVLLGSGEGFRLYGLLGMIIGLLLYLAGIWQVCDLIRAQMQKHPRKKQEKAGEVENNNKKPVGND